MADDLRALQDRRFDEIAILDVSGESEGTMSGTYVLVQTDATTLKRIIGKDYVELFAT